ncbi:class I SAM-dependent methyltransferase [Parvularcula lutaonensis]|uniref:Class I SAM-dependent methyltransferase n=1 Tax=Parvularcula lutaonensis TaxID=491923 RepID=A0ABV7MDP2_9PROT|nr:methyltransferase domain-containing protein [Parvularcula lutaonensis]GGY53775.1 hypothetical protein GCM10007148_23880 [Parvularcula lutaonensis]
MSGPGPKFSYKSELVAFARRLGLLGIVDWVYGQRRVSEYASANAAYQMQHPECRFPPAALVQRTYGTPSFQSFREWGARNAKEIAEAIERHSTVDAPQVLEWGCGLGRLAVHLVDRYAYTGVDIDAGSVQWCRDNLGGRFAINQPKPPLPFAAESFDVVFAVSIFTHLSERAHLDWRDEMLRVLKPGGVFIFTVHGDEQSKELSPSERQRYDAGQIVVRGGVSEGSRTFLAYHPDPYVRETLLEGYDVAEGPTPACGQTLYAGRKS